MKKKALESYPLRLSSGFDYVDGIGIHEIAKTKVTGKKKYLETEPSM
jgi:hypothetical protein